MNTNVVLAAPANVQNRRQTRYRFVSYRTWWIMIRSCPEVVGVRGETSFDEPSLFSFPGWRGVAGCHRGTTLSDWGVTWTGLHRLSDKAHKVLYIIRDSQRSNAHRHRCRKGPASPSRRTAGHRPCRARTPDWLSQPREPLILGPPSSAAIPWLLCGRQTEKETDPRKKREREKKQVEEYMVILVTRFDANDHDLSGGRLAGGCVCVRVYMVPCARLNGVQVQSIGVIVALQGKTRPTSNERATCIRGNSFGKEASENCVLQTCELGGYTEVRSSGHLYVPLSCTWQASLRKSRKYPPRTTVP